MEKKSIKYSLTAVQQANDEVMYEISFEDQSVIREEDERIFLINNEQTLFKINIVRKVNHVETPNDLYDYRLFATRV